jgi:hypothetical protein
MTNGFSVGYHVVMHNQGGIIPVDLSTRLTQNLKSSHEIFVGGPAHCRENKLWATYHRNKVLVTRIKFLSHEID